MATKDLPAIGTKVYIASYYAPPFPDYYECIVKAHNADGSIQAFEPGIQKLHTLTSWVTEAELQAGAK